MSREPTLTERAEARSRIRAVLDRLGGERVLLVAICLGLLVAFVRRLLIGWDAPLWLDETFTGAMAIQPDLAGLARAMLEDVAAPAYHVLMWAWEKLFGASNFAMRLPSFLLSIAAPVLILLQGPADRATRLIWAALVALWVPSFFYATEARPYALLYLLGTAQAILYYRLIEQPILKRAIFWSAISALMALTHYHSLLLTGLQGLYFLARFRGRALATWPAALLFIPVALWVSVHLPLLLRIADPRFAWQQLLSPRDIASLPAIVVGLGPKLSWLPLAAIAGTLSWQLIRKSPRNAECRHHQAEVITACASLLAILIVFGLGFTSPSFTRRYVIPFAPGMLLGVAVWARLWARRFPPTPVLLILLLTAAALYDLRRWWTTPDHRWSWTWQAASKDLERAGAKRLLFFWDNPATEVLGEQTLAEVGAFFFRRDGAPVEAHALRLGVQRDRDPNVELLRWADRPGDAFIWAFDTDVPRTLAIRHPPAVTKIDPSWLCRRYPNSNSGSGVYACILPER
jgi:hypothetical protein